MAKIITSLSDTVRDAYAGSVFRYWFYQIFGGTVSFIKNHLPDEYHRMRKK